MMTSNKTGIINHFIQSATGLLVVLVLEGCGGSAPSTGPANVAQRAVPVTVSAVVQKTVPVQVRAIGNVQAYSTVAVKAQVGGELISVHFKEGQDVKRGEPLFVIDPRSFEAQLKQAEANLARDTVQLVNARKEVSRYTELFNGGFATQQQYDQIRTNAEALEAAVQADQAALENAKLQLEYSSIESPIDGRTGNLMVHEGNIVKANDTTPLVIINQISPIYVAFSVPEQDLPEIKKYMAVGKLKVETIIPKSEGSPPQGILTFMDNTVDSATGTIQLKATFPNRDRTLWPGQFVNVVLTITTQPNAVIIPTQAVQTGQKGQYVFVVRPDLTVESRSVVVSGTIEGETIIGMGLKTGETVVTDGQLRLFPGAKVEIKTENLPAAPEAKVG
jgi:membrane fusion protein, multidrug efflux system